MRAPLALLALSLLCGASAAAPDGSAPTASRAFLNGDAVGSPQDAVEIQRCAGADQAQEFRAQALKAGRALGLTADEAARAAELYAARCSGAASSAGSVPHGDGPKYDPKKAAAVSARAARTAELLDQRRASQDAPGGAPATGAEAPAGGPQRGIDYKALNALPGRQAYAMGKRAAGTPAIDLHSLGDDEVAPEPTLAARAKSLVTPSKALVAEDLKTLQEKLGAFELPPGAASLSSSDASLGEFVQWAKTVQPSGLPSIAYGILPKGIVGDFKMGVLTSDAITLNHSIRDMPADERSAVLFHELYHYWDNKVARLHYANVSYGFIDPAHMPEHEYDAYYMTALYWRQIKSGAPDDALARLLDRYSIDPNEVRATVDRIVGGKK